MDSILADPDGAYVDPAQLRRGGYRVVGVVGAPAADPGWVDLLVRAALVEAHPGWWQQLVAVTDRAFDLRHGPVQQVLGAEIALHLAH